MLIKRIYIIVDDKRERIEDFIADNILKRWDEMKGVNDFRKISSLVLINAVNSYITCYGLPALTNEIKEQIADANVKVLKKLNNKLKKQLKKKSKGYIERHGTNPMPDKTQIERPHED